MPADSRTRAAPVQRSPPPGATSTTSPSRHWPRPLILKISSSACSQGTSSSRSVMLPVTESPATRLKPQKSAINCSAVRTSMSWKFSDSFPFSKRANPGRPHRVFPLTARSPGARIDRGGRVALRSLAPFFRHDRRDRRTLAPFLCVSPRGRYGRQQGENRCRRSLEARSFHGWGPSANPGAGPSSAMVIGRSVQLPFSSRTNSRRCIAMGSIR